MKPPAIEDAVLPYSSELEDAQPFVRPFMARFEKDDRRLLFVAADHGCDPKTFRLIDHALASHRVRLVIIEGYAAAKGIDPPELVARMPEWAAEGFCKGAGEPGYVAFHARERGIWFVGGEPDEHVLVDAARKEGFTSEDLLGFYFLRQLPQFRRDGTLETKGLEESFRYLVTAMAERGGMVEAGAHFSFEVFKDWYREKQGKPFDLETVDPGEAAPIATGTYVTQHVSSAIGIGRDRFLISQIASLLEHDKELLVVYGGSHYPTLRPAIELLMGKAIEIKTPADIH